MSLAHPPGLRPLSPNSVLSVFKSTRTNVRVKHAALKRQRSASFDALRQQGAGALGRFACPGGGPDRRERASPSNARSYHILCRSRLSMQLR